ncbi:hypothetical protein ARMSODRAFT_1026717 [Armillaria solidipes]|uniref:Uncharacterized protein n=1 Tax=Armillaria solidipes TaxID=1076256 RepID=A0A2H3AUB9_9AGAR|nr:hypothetical protein ARMSODRAFT_1026717 [Armillaria solidipes]
MLWILRSTRSGCVFNPTALQCDVPTITDLLVSPLHVDIDTSNLFCNAIELENAHSAKDDLEELDDIHIMPQCDLNPLAASASSSVNLKRPAGAEQSSDGHEHGSDGEGSSILWRHKKRHKARVKKYEVGGHQPSGHTLELIHHTTDPIHTSLATEALPSARGVYSALNFKESEPEREYAVDELLALGFSEVPWEGFDLRLIVDNKGQIVAVIAGQLHDPGYSAACMDAHDEIMQEGAAANFRKASSHR